MTLQFTAYTTDCIVRRSAELEELKRNPDAMKRIAREKYFMKTANEDIYVIRTRPAGDEAAQ